MEPRDERIRVRKIIVGAQVSLDGVMQAPGGPREDPTNGFTFGGWMMPYFDQVFGEEIERVFGEKCDLLLGRETYEIFAAQHAEQEALARVCRLLFQIAGLRLSTNKHRPSIAFALCRSLLPFAKRARKGRRRPGQRPLVHE
jgi:hypothetical protein